jgi:transposase
MPQSSLRSGGVEVHQASIAVAYVAQDHGAAVVSRGTIGTRPCDLDQVMRPLPSQATPLVLVSEAGPCGYGLYGYLTKRGHDCWVVAPAWMPKKAGDRGTTDRRAARPLARLLRAGDLPPGSVPQVDDAASRDLSRAREERLRDLNAAQSRLQAVLLRQDMRDTGQATWPPRPSLMARGRGLSDASPTARLPGVGAGGHRPHRTPPASGTGTPGAGQHVAPRPRS